MKKTRQPSRIVRRLKNQIKKNKRAFIVYSVLRALVIFVLVSSVLRQDYETTMTCVLVLFLFLMPSIFEELFHAEIPQLFQIIIFIFIFAAEILGEVGKFFVYVRGWDTMLHTTTGFLWAAIGFSLVDLLNRNTKRVNLSPAYVALMGFCFSMTIGVLWEFFEVFADLNFGADMQKDTVVQAFNSVSLKPNTPNVTHVRDIVQTVITTADGTRYVIDGGYLDIGILDTMKDLFVNFIGAVVFSALGYVYLKKHPDEPMKGGLIISPKDETEIIKEE